MSVSEAAERLGITTEEAYELVVARELRTVESHTGRRVVPIEALEEYADQKAVEEYADQKAVSRESV